MFSLADAAFSGSILGCGDGPASFNAEATRKGCRVTSIDPIYYFDRECIATRISAVSDEIMEQIEKHRDDYVWNTIQSPDQLKNTRHAAMNDFLADFDSGLEQGRYIAGSAPELPFSEQQFDLALCSHFLFLYSEQFGYDSHLQSIRSLARVAKEVRIFPLYSMHDLKVSVHLKPILLKLEKEGLSTDIVPVNYEFLRGATEMLAIRQ